MTPYDDHDDDRPVGRLLTRREMLALLGGLGATLLVGCGPEQATNTPAAPAATPPPTSAATSTAAAPTAAATSTALNAEAATAEAATPVAASPTADVAAAPDCVVRPDLTEGPYFVEEADLNRSDIRTDPATGTAKEGAPLALALVVSQVAAGACTPLAGAQVDIWHCDAAGAYSDVSDAGFTTTGQKFLRGYQLTDADGKVAFTTIYPGWYSGRAVHIHFKIRTTGADGQVYEFTSQFFFDDALSDQVFTQAPYAAKGTRDTRNSNDNIYQGGGDQLLLTPTASNGSYSSTFGIALDLSDAESGADDSAGGGGPGGGPGGLPPGGPPGSQPTPTP